MKGYMEEYLEDKRLRIEETLQKFYDRLEEKLAVNRGINSDTFRKAIYNPSKDAVVTSGKRIRPILTHLTHELVGGSSKWIDDLAIFPELLHKGSLIIDDIEDKARKRDGRPPLYKYKSYGISTALNTGIFLNFVPSLILKEIEIDDKLKSEILQNYFDEGTSLSIGQSLDIYWEKSKTLPTKEQYLQMTADKNSAIRFAVKLGAILGNGREDQKRSLVAIAEYMAKAYQLKNDLLSLSEDAHGYAHEYGDDITQGKVTLMVLRTLQEGDENAERLKYILSLKTRDLSLIGEAINIMGNNGSIGYVEQTAKDLVKKAKEKLSMDFPHSDSRTVLSELIEYGITRKK